MSLIRHLHRQLTTKERSAIEITTGFLERIEQIEPKLHSFLTITASHALEAARRVDNKLAQGEQIGLLEGIPIAIKDNLCTKGIPTTCGSQILRNFIPPYESTVTARLQHAGAIILGKTNLDEFAMGSSTENSGYQVTANPWDISRVPGGSSGGSAAAVAGGECIVALGSDTGGSIRQPASFCGVVGLKPTYGLVSRYGLVAYASSLDQIGPFARTVEDASILLSTIAGNDPQDSTSLDFTVPDYCQYLKRDLHGIKIGLIKETLGTGLSADVSQSLQLAIQQLESLGAQVTELSCPRFGFGLAAYYIIAPSEASANLARYDAVRYGLREEADSLISMYKKTRSHGLGDEVKRRIMIGTYALSAGYYDDYYLKAQKVRTLIKEDFEKALAQVDVLISPTSPTTAFRIGEKTTDPLSMYLSDLMTIPVNLAGLPAISVPCGFDELGLPMGLQIISNALREDLLFQVAHAYEQSTDWHTRTPALD